MMHPLIVSVLAGARAALVISLALLWAPAQAQENPFAGGWTLQTKVSKLNFQSVKKKTIVESSGFASMTGAIDEGGNTVVKVQLDSVDTAIDLRNVRMRFLFFETFNFPEATITTKVDPSLLTDLATLRRKSIPLTYTIDLHGVTKAYEADVVATLLSDDLVSIASSTPISVAVADFNLLEGLTKLQEAAGVDIIPSATVSFDMMFARNTIAAAAGTSSAAVTATTAPENPTKVALEAEGDFDAEACKGRFEILSRTGNIYFESGSSRLEAKSAPLLDSLADIISRCPGMLIEVGGHTDSIGSATANQRLSRARAGAVTAYLLGKGDLKDKIVSNGYGEAMPIADNATKEGRWKNRRIGFKVLK